MKIGRFGKLLTTMYSDKLYIRRYETITNEDYSTSIKLQDLTTIEAIPCRISFATQDLSELTRIDYNNIEMQVKVFCSFNTDIKKGDLVRVERMQDEDNTEIESYEGIAGLPYRFSTHQEFIIIQKGEA